MNIEKEKKRLESIRAQLEKLKDKQKEYEAEQKLLLKNLKTDFGCSSIKEAEKLLQELEEEAETLEEEITDKRDSLLASMKEEGLI